MRLRRMRVLVIWTGAAGALIGHRSGSLVPDEAASSRADAEPVWAGHSRVIIARAPAAQRAVVGVGIRAALKSM